MAFAKRFNKDILLLSHFKEFVNHLFDKEDKPCELLASETTKLKILSHFTGDEEYESFEAFSRSTKNEQKRADRKIKATEFIKEHNLTLYPHSSYSIFLNEQKAEYEEKYDDKSPKEIREIMTKVWTEMSEAKKKKYNESFAAQKQEFIDKVKAIDESYVTYFDKKQAPKKAPTPYIMFVQENMKLIKEENPTLPGKDIMRKVCEKWKAITDEEKQKYHDKCAAATPSDAKKPVTTKPKAEKESKPAKATKETKETKETVSVTQEKEKPVATKKKGDLKTLAKKLDNSDEEAEESAQHEEVVVKKSSPKKKPTPKSDNETDGETEVKPKTAAKKPAAKKKKDAVVENLVNNDEE